MKQPLLAAVLLACLVTSCASIMTGSSDSVSVISTPPGTFFTTNIGVSGRTPQVVTVPASQDLVVNFRRKGYEPTTVMLNSRMSGWILGNILFGGPIGLVVDLLNPNAKTHSSHLTAQLVRKPGGGVEPEELPEARPTEVLAVPREIEIRH